MLYFSVFLLIFSVVFGSPIVKRGPWNDQGISEIKALFRMKDVLGDNKILPKSDFGGKNWGTHKFTSRERNDPKLSSNKFNQGNHNYGATVNKNGWDIKSLYDGKIPRQNGVQGGRYHEMWVLMENKLDQKLQETISEEEIQGFNMVLEDAQIALDEAIVARGNELDTNSASYATHVDLRNILVSVKSKMDAKLGNCGSPVSPPMRRRKRCASYSPITVNEQVPTKELETEALWQIREILGKDLVLPGHSGEGSIPRDPDNYEEFDPKAIYKDAENLDDAWNKITDGLKQKISQKVINKNILKNVMKTLSRSIVSRKSDIKKSENNNKEQLITYNIRAENINDINYHYQDTYQETIGAEDPDMDSDIGISPTSIEDLREASEIQSVSEFDALVAFKEILPDDILPNGIENVRGNMENDMESIEPGDLVANAWDDDNVWDKVASKLVNHIKDKKLTKAQYKALRKGMSQWNNSLKKRNEELNRKNQNGEARESNEIRGYETHYETYSSVVEAASEIDSKSLEGNEPSSNEGDIEDIGYISKPEQKSTVKTGSGKQNRFVRGIRAIKQTNRKNANKKTPKLGKGTIRK